MSVSEGGVFDADYVCSVDGEPIQTGPLVLPTGYVPAVGLGVATKAYVDAHGSDPDQVQILYVSKEGPAAGVTADGLTLRSAFSTLDDAMAAAGLAVTTKPAVITCLDDGTYTLSATITVPDGVDVYMPNATVLGGGHYLAFAAPPITTSRIVRICVGDMRANMNFTDVNACCSFQHNSASIIFADDYVGVTPKVVLSMNVTGVDEGNLSCTTGYSHVNYTAAQTSGTITAQAGGVVVCNITRFVGHIVVDASAMVLLSCANTSGANVANITESSAAGALVSWQTPRNALLPISVVDGAAASWGCTANCFVSRWGTSVTISCAGFTTTTATASHGVLGGVIGAPYVSNSAGTSSATMVGEDNGTLTAITAVYNRATGVITIYKGTNGDFSGAGQITVPSFSLTTAL